LIWAAMREAGLKNQWLIEGPWTHGFDVSTSFGDEDYGPSAVIELDSQYLRWFDTWLKGKSVGQDKVPHVRVFDTGLNEWLDMTDWPESDCPTEQLFLSGAGTEGSKTGKLGSAALAGDKPSEYDYDPSKATIPEKLSGNPMQQGSLTIPIKKDDSTLMFESEPMKDALSIGGPIRFDFYFETSAKDTDFFAEIADEDETGAVRVFSLPGRIDVKYLSGYDNPSLLSAGKVYHATIDLWDATHEFKSGHKIVLFVNSDEFPGTARNLNTGEPIASATKMAVAHEQILHDAAHPSTLSFRVLNSVVARQNQK